MEYVGVTLANCMSQSIKCERTMFKFIGWIRLRSLQKQPKHDLAYAFIVIKDNTKTTIQVIQVKTTTTTTYQNKTNKQKPLAKPFVEISANSF